MRLQYLCAGAKDENLAAQSDRRHSRRRWQRCGSRPSTPAKGLGIADWDRSLVIFFEPDLAVAPARGSTGASLDTGRVKRRSVSTIAAIERDDLSSLSRMESVQLCSKPFRRGPQRVVSDMSITLCRRWIGVAEKATDYFKAEAARNKVGSVGVSVVVQPVLPDRRFCDYYLPELFDVLKRPSCRITRE